MMDLLGKNWKAIADEGIGLPIDEPIDVSGFSDRTELVRAVTNPSWIKNWDGYRGWLNYGIIVDGKDIAARILPNTTNILCAIPSIKFACLSILKAGQIIPLHAHEEMRSASLLTYHLGLDVPNECYINVAGEFITHQNGKEIIFDGSLPHYSFNASTQDRMILHCEFSS